MSDVRVTPPADALEPDRVERIVEAALGARDEADVTWLGSDDLSSPWALAPDALQFLSRLVPRLKPRHIFEFGSGASTRVMARAIGTVHRAGRISSVDHDPEFVDATRRLLEADGTAGQVRLQFAPLIVGRRLGVLVPLYGWSRAMFASSDPADLVLVDGPPSVLGGRLGALFQAVEVSRRGTLILLDDARRKREQEALTQWSRDCGATVAIRMLPALERGMAAILVGELNGLAERSHDTARPGRSPDVRGDSR